MGKAAKLKEVEAAPLPPSPMRQPLVSALAKVAALQQALAENKAEQNEAHQKIRTIEKAIGETEEAIVSAHPSEKPAHRTALQAAREGFEDWQEHLVQLQRKAGDHGGLGLIDRQNTLKFELDLAKGDIGRARGELLARHPRTWALFQRLHELRAELRQIEADIFAIEGASGIPAAERDWHQVINLEQRPQPDVALVAWIEALLTDPSAELQS